MPRPRKPHDHFGTILHPHHGPGHHGPGPHNHPPHIDCPVNIDEPSTLMDAASYLAEIFRELAEQGEAVLSDTVTVTPPNDVHLVFRLSKTEGQHAIEAALVWDAVDDMDLATTTLASARAARKAKPSQ